jgi:hypothetical protein
MDVSLGKHTRSSYVGLGNRSDHAFDSIHLDIWGPCSTTEIDGQIFCDFHRLLYTCHMIVLDEEQERST